MRSIADEGLPVFPLFQSAFTTAATCARATRPPGPRHGPPPRGRPLQPLLHRLALGAQVGGPGHPGPVPLRPPTLGPARVGHPVPLQGGQPQAPPAPQDARPTAATAAAA